MNLGMDDSGQRESGRHKVDPYRSLHTQWMMPQHQMPQHQMKDNHTMKLMNLISERDRAIIDRNQALKERREALEERDVAISQRDAAIMERTTAIRERDNAIAALEYAHENGFNYSTKPMHHQHQHQHHHQQHLQHVHPQPESPYNHAREMHSSEAYPVAAEAKVRKAKRPRKESKVEGDPSKKASRAPRKNKRGGGVVEGSDQQLRVVKSDDEWRGEFGGGEDLNKDHHHDWKDQDLGLNQVTFDESMMPVPVCSCTGKYQQCYKWGNGGWQSACCTTTMSMYPLPVMANKRHARMGGRKMSGAVFTRLLSRLAAEGHDLSVPLDLKDHWSKHGTNRYITIK